MKALNGKGRRDPRDCARMSFQSLLQQGIEFEEARGPLQHTDHARVTVIGIATEQDDRRLSIRQWQLMPGYRKQNRRW